MASGITQALPLAIGQIVNQQAQVQPARDSAQVASAKQVAQITQVVAAQNINKVKQVDKDRGVQVPKRSEPNFNSQEEGDEKSSPTKLKTKRKRSSDDADLDVVA